MTERSLHLCRERNYPNYQCTFSTVASLLLGIFGGVLISLILTDSALSTANTKKSSFTQQTLHTPQKYTHFNSALKNGVRGEEADGLFSLLKHQKDSLLNNESFVHFGRGWSGAIHADDFPAIRLSQLDGYKPRESLTVMNEPWNEILQIHTSLRDDISVSTFEIFVKSLLVTQNLEKTKLVIWMTEDWLHSKDLSKVQFVQNYRYTPHRFVEMRLVNLETLTQSLTLTCDLHFPQAAHLSLDIIETTVLFTYGGIWLEPSSIVMRDLSSNQPKQHIIIGNSEVNSETPFVYVSGNLPRSLLMIATCTSLKNSYPKLKMNNVLSRCRQVSLCKEHILEISPPNLQDKVINGGGIPELPCFTEDINPSILWQIPNNNQSDNWMTSVMAVNFPSDLLAETKCGQLYRSGLEITRSVIAHLMDLSIGHDIRLAPVTPMSWLTADVWPLTPTFDEDVDFSIFTILARSNPSNAEGRHAMRSQLNSKGWRLHDTMTEPNFSTRLLFATNLLDESSSSENIVINAELRWESAQHKDIILLPFYNEKQPEKTLYETSCLQTHATAWHAVQTKSNESTPISGNVTETTNKVTMEVPPTLAQSAVIDIEATEVNAHRPTAIQRNLSIFLPKGNACIFTPTASSCLKKNSITTDDDSFRTVGTTGIFPSKQNRILSNRGFLDEHDNQKPTEKTDIQSRVDKKKKILMLVEREELKFGFIPRSLEVAIVRWLGQAETRYLLLLYNDSVFVNLHAFYDLLQSMSNGKLFWKTTAVTSVSMVFNKSTGEEQILESFQLKRENTKKRMLDSKTPNANNTTKVIIKQYTPLELSSPIRFDGLLVSRDLVPNLLSYNNPFFVASTLQNFKECQQLSKSFKKHEDMPASASVNDESAFWEIDQQYNKLLFSSSRKISNLPLLPKISVEDICTVAYTHPINQRLRYNRFVFASNKTIFLQNKSNPQQRKINTISPHSINYSSSSFPNLVPQLKILLSSILFTKDCKHLELSLDSPLNYTKSDVLQTLHKTLIVSDVPSKSGIEAFGSWARLLHLIDPVETISM